MTDYSPVSRLVGQGLALCWLLLISTQVVASAPVSALFEQLEYRHIGPIGNRVIAVAGVPGDANTYYIGAASGGLFKSGDGGHHWSALFDQQPASSIGSIAIAASDPKVIWVGTGETFIRANISIGNGVYRSTDGGRNWQHLGLEKTGRIGRIVVHPENPDIAWVAALGSLYAPQEERGVYRTGDGGKNWERVLFVDQNTGASDLVIDPNNPRILLAGMWQMSVDTFSRTSGGPGSSLHISRDGGDSWTALEGNGLPNKPWGKVGLTLSAADSDRIYALIETSSNQDFSAFEDFQGVLWRSDDGGESWEMTNASNALTQRPLYYSRALAAPDDADEVYFMATRQSVSLDGGKHFETSNPGYDHHDLWIDPLDSQRMISGHDGGVSISSNGGKDWFRPQLPIAQMYHAHTDNRIPYYVYGNRQDGSSMRGPSNSRNGSSISIGEWQSVGGCETGFSIPLPADNNVVWTGCYDGILHRFELDSGHSRDVSVWPVAVESWPAAELDYRFQWTFPIAISPHHQERVYAGSQYVHQSDDGGHSWKVISPDLTGNDPEQQQRSGGLTLDDAGPTIAPTLFALAESPLQAGVIWAGSNDGRVQLTRDGGANWRDLTAGLKRLPANGTISNIEPSHFDPGTAYLTVDRHQLNDNRPYLYKTTDYGDSWHSISGDIPETTFSYAHVIREDPVTPGLLYAGTENSLWVSFNDGRNWFDLRANLPHAPVHWLTIQPHFNDLVVATYGRGFWILDDITPLQQMAREGVPDKSLLYTPRPAYRFRAQQTRMAQPGDPAAGDNPEYGAAIHYFLTGEFEAVKVRILDQNQREVIALEDLPTDEGLNRVFWDLEYKKTDKVKLRTSPDENSNIKLTEGGSRDLDDGGRFSLLAPPGQYIVELTVDEEILSAELSVLKDPNSKASVADLHQQSEVTSKLRDMTNEAVAIINELEWLRNQLFALIGRLEALTDTENADAEADESIEKILEKAELLERQLAELEGTFFDLRLTAAGQDSLRWKRLLYARITNLARRIQMSDFVPTEAQMSVFSTLDNQLDEITLKYLEIKRKEINDFNTLMENSNFGALIP